MAESPLDDPPLRPRHSVCRRALSAGPRAIRHYTLDEPQRRLSGQRANGELLSQPENRAGSSFMAPAPRPAETSSNISRASTIPAACIRPWATSAQLSLSVWRTNPVHFFGGRSTRQERWSPPMARDRRDLRPASVVPSNRRTYAHPKPPRGRSGRNPLRYRRRHAFAQIPRIWCRHIGPQRHVVSPLPPICSRSNSLSFRIYQVGNRSSAQKSFRGFTASSGCGGIGPWFGAMEPWHNRVILRAAERQQLAAIVANRNRPRKHVERARIVFA